MPVMNGLTMLGELRKNEYGKFAKVIILTNLEPDDEILGHVLKDEPTYYFIKSDTELAELIEKIRDLFLTDGLKKN
jgi:CheY-like chemotaxis protein